MSIRVLALNSKDYKFFLSSIIYFGTLTYNYFTCCQNFDMTFGWLGSFYVILEGIYLISKSMKKSY